MKAPAYVVASLAALLFLTACSSDVEDTYETADLKINTAPYQYSSFESEILNLVNEHRTSVGLNHFNVWMLFQILPWNKQTT